MIPFKEFQKELEAAERLLKKFSEGKYTQKDQEKWLSLNIKVREIAAKNHQ